MYNEIDQVENKLLKILLNVRRIQNILLIALVVSIVNRSHLSKDIIVFLSAIGFVINMVAHKIYMDTLKKCSPICKIQLNCPDKSRKFSGMFFAGFLWLITGCLFIYFK